MAGLAPTPVFAGVGLDVATIRAGRVFGRIYRSAFPDPLGIGKDPTRFSDPRRRAPDRRFGVLYLGSSLKVCVLETLIRDGRDGVSGDLIMADAELRDRHYAMLRVTRSLRVIDLSGDGPVRMGVPSDVIRGRRQTLARQWSVAIHDHPAGVDGILYPSRLNTEINLAVYDRAFGKLSVDKVMPLIRAPGLADVLDIFQIALV